MSTPVQSVDDFLQVIRRSGLVEEARLMAVVEPWIGHAAAPPEPLLQALEDSGLLTRWQIDQLLKGRYKGFTLGKYRLLRLLGAGGMSSVYLGEHATLHSKAAVKVLPVKRVEQSSYLARFEREARQSARLNHPNIVRTFDLDTAGSIHFIAMEYVDGIDLHAKVKRDGPLPIREVAEYIRQAAIGLQHAHEEGLVHRDIKPANLILDTRGTVKILDLGLALAGGDEDGSLTREHDEKVLGTADYLAPEQATDSHKADRRSDVYSLGCTLYYLLVGKAPFASGKLAERLQSHLHKPPPNLLDQRPDVPIAIAELYFRMLQKHPDGRPQSAQDVADALGAWLGAMHLAIDGDTNSLISESRPFMQGYRAFQAEFGDLETVVIAVDPKSDAPSAANDAERAADAIQRGLDELVLSNSVQRVSGQITVTEQWRLAPWAMRMDALTSLVEARDGVSALAQPPRDGVYVLWTLPPVDPAALRAVVADVRARLAAKKTTR